MGYRTGLATLAAIAITAGCSGLPAAGGSGGDGAPPAYVNVVNTEEMQVQLVPQDGGAVRGNDHPAAFESAQLAALLISLRAASDDADSASTLSSPSRLERLGAGLSRAFARAGPRQDVAFVVYRRSRSGFFSGSARYVTSGRAFYQGNTLNLIFGEFDQAFSEFRDLSLNGFDYGARARSARVGGERLVASDAWRWHNGRRDWIEMDATPQAIEAARQSAPRVIESDASSAARPLQYGPAADRSGFIPVPPAPRVPGTTTTSYEPATGSDASDAPAASAGGGWARIEERLIRLKRLRDKNLINEQDYQAKKDELLKQLP